MAEICGTCMYLDKDNFRKHSYFGREWRTYRCIERCEYREETDKSCGYYKESLSSGKGQNDCFITTVVVNALGYRDDCIVLRTLRKFREEILQPDENKQNILLEYDVLGPLISESLKNDGNSKKLCHSIMYNYLIPITKMIREHNNLQAIASYTAMVNQYKNYYGITIDIENFQYSSEINYKDRGKGYSIYTNLDNNLSKKLVQQKNAIQKF